MRLNLILPNVEPNECDYPTQCPRKGWSGTRCVPRQQVSKQMVDAQYPQGTAWRCEGNQCGHVVRVSPNGVSQKPIAQRVNGMAVMRYMLGLRYGAVDIVLHRLGMGIGKTSVSRAVQCVAARVPGITRAHLLRGYQTQAVGAAITSVRWNGNWVTSGIVVDAVNGMGLSIDALPGQDATQWQAWLEPILDAGGAAVVVSDDADAVKHVSDHTGRAQHGCKRHVVRNTEALGEERSAIMRAGQDHALEAMQVTAEQAVADLESRKARIHARRPQDQQRLDKMDLRSANARTPSRGKNHEVAYRMRNRFMDRWNLWPRLTFYRTWQDADGNAIFDGTNNHCERAIGWWFTERYRSMRGDKQGRSALGMSRLIAVAGNNLSRGLNLADLMA